jgi:hypothetical protein
MHLLGETRTFGKFKSNDPFIYLIYATNGRFKKSVPKQCSTFDSGFWSPETVREFFSARQFFPQQTD